jgi:hypothetical protein
MSWTYSQSSGDLGHEGEFIAKGYAGLGACCNKPDKQDVPFQGPLPRGTYTIGLPMQDGGHMGPFVLPLAPWEVNNMFGRSGFFIHGDTPARDQSASNGCIILDRAWRTMIAQSGDATLMVVE